MSTNTHSPKTKVAPSDPPDAPVTPEQSKAQNPSGAKDNAILSWEAYEWARNTPLEERKEKCPFLKTMTPRGVEVDKGMQALEEMERQDAAIPDGTETPGADNASR